MWILGNTNNTYSGATTIGQGILRAQEEKTRGTRQDVVNGAMPE